MSDDCTFGLCNFIDDVEDFCVLKFVLTLIVMKFLWCHSGDEQDRLLPVMSEHLYEVFILSVTCGPHYDGTPHVPKIFFGIELLI